MSQLQTHFGFIFIQDYVIYSVKNTKHYFTHKTMFIYS